MTVPLPPDYCPGCGNLSFRFAAGARMGRPASFAVWRCWHCEPPEHYRYPEHYLPGEMLTTEESTERSGFYCPEEVRAAWPEGWQPPHPTGAARAAVAAMEGKLVYTTGYHGKSPEQLFAVVKRLGGMVIDIREAAYSKQPSWGHTDLVRRFQLRYSHVWELGNKNHRIPHAPVEIINPAKGMQRLLSCPYSPLVLLCQCPDFDQCHRSTVAQFLEARGYVTWELSWRT